MYLMCTGGGAARAAEPTIEGQVIPAYAADRRDVLRLVTNLLGNPDNRLNRAGEYWPRVTQAPEPPAITDWAKRWFAVNTAFGPISWGPEFSIEVVRGLFWSIYWGRK
ncbi:MAG: hypothetical protein ACI80V_000497 [Rhodothermales bacterium]|jgi:hypothetical protein